MDGCRSRSRSFELSMSGTVKVSITQSYSGVCVLCEILLRHSRGADGINLTTANWMMDALFLNCLDPGEHGIK